MSKKLVKSDSVLKWDSKDSQRNEAVISLYECNLISKDTLLSYIGFDPILEAKKLTDEHQIVQIVKNIQEK
jgi:hypothetical protein